MCEKSKMFNKDFQIYINHFSLATDFCNPNPCLHNGVCVVQETGYKCKCLPQFIGQNCEGIPPNYELNKTVNE